MSSEELSLKDKKAVVIGGGVIGASWAALFLASGLKVTLNDPNPDIKENFEVSLKEAQPALKALGYDVSFLDPSQLPSRLTYETDLAKALEDADFVQENAPERLEIKRSIWKIAEAHAPEHTLLFSSSSGIPAKAQSTEMQRPARLMIAHPFNPPSLMPLVEIVGSAESETLMAQAMLFYRALGKTPIRLKKEIPGFVANRLQTALLRECVNIVSQGVADVKTLDEIVQASLGIRWAVAGPFLSFYLGGGKGGFAHFLAQFAPSLEAGWTSMMQEKVSLSSPVDKLLCEQINKAYGSDVDFFEKRRDEGEVSVIQALKTEKS